MRTMLASCAALVVAMVGITAPAMAQLIINTNAFINAPTHLPIAIGTIPLDPTITVVFGPKFHQIPTLDQPFNVTLDNHSKLVLQMPETTPGDFSELYQLIIGNGSVQAYANNVFTAVHWLDVMGNATFAGDVAAIHAFEGSVLTLRGNVGSGIHGIGGGIYAVGTVKYVKGQAFVNSTEIMPTGSLHLWNVEINSLKNHGRVYQFGGNNDGMMTDTGVYHYFGGILGSAFVGSMGSMFLYGSDLSLSAAVPISPTLNEYTVTGHLSDGTFLNEYKIQAQPGAVVALGITPEPGTLALLGVGLGVVGLVARRRQGGCHPARRRVK